MVPTSAAEALVTSIFADLLGRDPGAAALAYWTGRVQAGSTTRQVAAAILGSAEYRRLVVIRTYQAILGRQPDSKALLWWTTRLKGGASLDVLRAYLLGSDELWSRSGSTTAGFIDALYRKVLGRAPDAGGRAFIQELLGGGVSRADVAKWLLATGEADRHIADVWYLVLLGRAPTAAEAIHWATALHAGTSEAGLLADLLATSEYLGP